MLVEPYAQLAPAGVVRLPAGAGFDPPRPGVVGADDYRVFAGVLGNLAGLPSWRVQVGDERLDVAVRAARGVRDVVAQDAVPWDGSGRRGDPEVGDDEDFAVFRADVSDLDPLEGRRGGGVRRERWRPIAAVIRCSYGVNGAVPRCSRARLRSSGGRAGDGPGALGAGALVNLAGEGGCAGGAQRELAEAVLRGVALPASGGHAYGAVGRLTAREGSEGRGALRAWRGLLAAARA